MKKRIFYTIDHEFYDGEMERGPTGHKTVNAYTIEQKDGAPSVELFFQVECDNDEDSIEVMKEYLIDNGHGDEEVEFKIL